LYLRLFHIIVDRLQQVTESDNKDKEVILLIIKTRKTGSQYGAIVASLVPSPCTLF